MKHKLIALIIASLGLVLGLYQAPTAYAATHRVTNTHKVSKTGYMKKKNNTAIYKMSGAARHTKIKKIGTLSTYGNPTWFVTKKRSVVTNGKVKKYFYVTKSDKKVKGWVRTYTVKKSKKSFNNLYKVAKSKLGHRYVYGAVGPTVFDCSGYTKYCFKKAAKKSLPRVAQSQYRSYKKVSSHKAKKGDLVFFGTSTGNISHVGIYVGRGKMIDAQNSGVKNERVYVPWWHAVGYSRPVNFKA